MAPIASAGTKIMSSFSCGTTTKWRAKKLNPPTVAKTAKIISGTSITKGASSLDFALAERGLPKNTTMKRRAI